MGDAQAGTVIEWLADCFDVGLAAMALAFADQSGNAGPRGYMLLGNGPLRPPTYLGGTS